MFVLSHIPAPSLKLYLVNGDKHKLAFSEEKEKAHKFETREEAMDIQTKIMTCYADMDIQIEEA